jgi:riboflavin biosynthesis pyrimidine reductase
MLSFVASDNRIDHVPPPEGRPGRPRTWESEAERKRAYRRRRAAELSEPLAVRFDAQQARAEAAAARTGAAAARRDAAAWKARADAAEARAETAAARAATASAAAEKARAERDVARRLLTNKLQWARDPRVLHGDPAALLALIADLYKELSAKRRELSDLRRRLAVAESAASTRRRDA